MVRIVSPGLSGNRLGFTFQNSRCIPRPMKPRLITDPPQVDPLRRTNVGSGQNCWLPLIIASPEPR